MATQSFVIVCMYIYKAIHLPQCSLCMHHGSHNILSAELTQCGVDIGLMFAFDNRPYSGRIFYFNLAAVTT